MCRLLKPLKHNIIMEWPFQHHSLPVNIYVTAFDDTSIYNIQYRFLTWGWAMPALLVILDAIGVDGADGADGQAEKRY